MLSVWVRGRQSLCFPAVSYLLSSQAQSRNLFADRPLTGLRNAVCRSFAEQDSLELSYPGEEDLGRRGWDKKALSYNCVLY